MFKFLIIALIIIITISVILYTGKEFLLNKFKSFLIEKIESSSPIGIRIKDIGYIPVKGIRLADVTFYKDKLYKEKIIDISSLYIKFPILKLLRNKIFSPTITLYNFNLENMSINGAFGFSIVLTKRIETAREALGAIQNIWLKNIDLKNEMLDIKNINGAIDISPSSIKTGDIRFILKDEPCVLNFEILNPVEKPSLNLKVTSSKFNLNTQVKKEEEIYNIPKVEGNLLNSSFEFIGEFKSFKEPILSLYGKADVDIKDISYFASNDFKRLMESLNPEGKIQSSIYFKGNIKESSLWEVGIKSNIDYIKIYEFKVDKFYMDARIKDGVLTIPLLSAYAYKGTLVSSMQLDLRDEYIPYNANCKLSNINIAELFKNTKLGDKGIRGVLFSEFAVEGDVKNINSMEGAGRIFVDNANLGPVPLLTPLLGNLYGYFQGIFPGLQRINITRGGCDFYIANRKISTNNLILWGDVVSIHAKGYIDFDKNLNFEVENKFAEPEKAKEGDWQATLQEMIARVGKLMSKAYLTGTLEKPQWKFQYLNGVKEVFKGGLEKVLKGIFE